MTIADTSLTVFDHVRLVEDSDAVADAMPGVYRVVGTHDDSFTLLRVTDADGHRANTGDLLSVEHAHLSAFEPADNPDGNRSPVAALAGAADGLVWQLRVFGRSLAARPLLSVAALIVAAVGLVGDQFLAGPDWAFGLAVFAGSLALAALGSNLF